MADQCSKLRGGPEAFGERLLVLQARPYGLREGRHHRGLEDPRGDADDPYPEASSRASGKVRLTTPPLEAA